MTKKIVFFERWFWFKSNNLGLTLGTNLKFYIIVAKVLKLKIRKFWGLFLTFVEVKREKLVRESCCPPPPPPPPSIPSSWIGLRDQNKQCPEYFFYIYLTHFAPDLYLLPCFRFYPCVLIHSIHPQYQKLQSC